MSGLANFHFLRPEWLLLLLPAAFLLWSMVRRQDPERGLKSVIAPELLKHLVVQGENREDKVKPLHLLAIAWLLGIAALAGPAWQKENTPFSEDRSALFIVMKVTPSMLAQDIQPGRLERGVHKVGELLARRPGTRTGLVAYAGTSHLVMPLTSDRDIITYFASELDPDVMPESGDDPVKAVALAAARLQRSGMPGSIVLVADSIDPVAQDGLARVHEESGIDIHIYAVAAGPDVVPPPGSPPAPYLDEKSMRDAARAGGGAYVPITPDEYDLEQLDSRVTRSIASAPVNEGERWKDAGYYLLWLLLPLSLMFWRRGGGVVVGAER